MKSKLSIFFVVFVLICNYGYSASVINWQGSGIRDTDNSSLISGSPSENYYIMLVQAANGTTIGFNSGTLSAGSGETLLLTANWSDVYDYDGALSYTFQQGVNNPGAGAGIASVSGSSYLYTVILNASTPGVGVTKYTVLEGSTPTGAGANFVYNNDLQNGVYTAPGNNTWQSVAVPEPSTIGLLLVGAGLVAFRRMRRS